MALRDKKTFVGAPSGFPSSLLSNFWEDAFLNDRTQASCGPSKERDRYPPKDRYSVCTST